MTTNDNTQTHNVNDFIDYMIERAAERRAIQDALAAQAEAERAAKEAKKLAEALAAFPEPMRPYGQYELLNGRGGKWSNLVFRLPACAPFAAWRTQDGGYGFHLPYFAGDGVTLDAYESHFCPIEEAIAKAREVWAQADEHDRQRKLDEAERDYPGKEDHMASQVRTVDDDDAETLAEQQATEAYAMRTEHSDNALLLKLAGRALDERHGGEVTDPIQVSIAMSLLVLARDVVTRRDMEPF